MLNFNIKEKNLVVIRKGLRIHKIKDRGTIGSQSKKTCYKKSLFYKSN